MTKQHLHLDPQSRPLETPLARFYQKVECHPDKLYMTQPLGDGQVAEYTWAQAADQAQRMASYLKSLDLPAQSNIAIISKNCAHWILSDLAIWMAGHVSVPLYPTLMADTVEQILTHSECKAAFIGKLDAWDMMKDGVPEEVTCIAMPLSPEGDFVQWDDVMKLHQPLEQKTERDLDEVATIIYTSGTTGMPKGVVHSFATMAYSVQGILDVIEVNGDDRGFSYLPLSHVGERMIIELVSLYQGSQVFFGESLETFASDLQRARPTVFFAVPRIWIKFYMGVLASLPQKKLNIMLSIPILSGIVKRKIKAKLGLDQARICISGAAPISQTLLNWYNTLDLELREVYGMTENMAYSHVTQEGKQRAGYVGQPNPCVDVRIADNGEIQVKSKANMLGYYKEPEKTAETLTDDGYLCTGDVGEPLADGSLKITGRIKEIFKTSKGKYVAPAPIENKLLANQNIELAMVTGWSIPQPVALIQLSEMALANAQDEAMKAALTQQLEDCLKQVNQQFAAAEKLRSLIVVSEPWTLENGSLTPTLKIKRNIIEQKYNDMIENWYQTGQAVIWE